MPQWRVPVSKLLLFVAIVIVIHPQQPSGELHLTYHGTFCLGSCKSEGGTYFCDSIDRGETEIKSMMCSPKNQTTVQGKECSNECAQGERDYYWCDSLFGPDNCGPVWNNTNYITTYGALCYDQCATRGYNYYWCHTSEGWDYCSPRPNVDYLNNACEATHPCAKHDESYYWCNVDWRDLNTWDYLKFQFSGYRWGYCGLQTPKTFFRSSTSKKLCGDNCEYYWLNYYYCYTSEGDWDYCSPWPNVTYRDVPCRDDHSCDLHGYGYYWCYTDNSWDYCGLIEGFECQCSQGLRTKRQVREHVFCRCVDRGNRQQVDFYLNPAANIARDGTQFRDNIETIISMWDNDLLTNQPGTLRRTDTFRIDMQGMVNRDNRRYYNLQIQRNVPRQRGQSTTYSQVLVPENLEGVSTRYVRGAFIRSYKETAGITIIVSSLQRRGQ